MELPSLRQVLIDHDLIAKKQLGQNFILDVNLLDKIVRSSKNAHPECFEKGTIIEIGPGPGGLTRQILENGAKKLIAIEKDERCLSILDEISNAYPNRLISMNTDALKVDAATLGEAPRAVIANLPYNVGTALLIGWLEQASNFVSMTLMFQKEVAERLVAVPRTADYGRLSILVQWLCNVKILFTVPKECFTPSPKVTSAIVQIEPLKEPRFKANKKILENLTLTVFNQRRKMLRSSLKAFGDVEKLCEKTGIDPTARPEELTVEQFCKMACAIEELKK
ncbi:MAG: 16S rRNA (adenine(1518)-N(6)/adenine(1519)-N(6))-dimethyltransferase RsmA [Alphaproteobacteria bacterium]|nr:16S rRNA (adenine(1518)-N(6)/adenine(1519)-N(6))-dimethyltransferase RsmA [Alphaproteobacteria bacterium]